VSTKYIGAGKNFQLFGDTQAELYKQNVQQDAT
jgi:hypothetical protein